MPSSSPRATSLALYRSILRVALRMPDSHRTNLLVFRARSEFDASRDLAGGSPEQAERWNDAEIYRDNLEHQAEHLNRLVGTSTLIPIDLRQSRAVNSPAAAHPSAGTCLNPSHHHTAPFPEPKPRRRLITAITARERNQDGRQRSNERVSRFMSGPEPSWVARRRESGP